MLNKKMKRLPFALLTLLVLSACGEVGQSPSFSSSNSSSISISENGTDGLMFTPSIYDGKEGYLVSGYEGTSKDVIIPNTFNKSNVFGVRSLAFYNPFVVKQIENIVFPENLKFIGAGAFQSHQLTSITIPDAVTTIGEYAFRENQFLTSVTIPKSVTTIGSHAFSNNYFQPFTIYVEAVSKPEGWDEYWYDGDPVTIIWDYKNQQ
jgi:hypothetical protein